MKRKKGLLAIPRLEFRQLRYFLAIVEEGSMRKAAGALGISQPPLSRQIHQLEFELKVELFERSGRGMVLSGAGRELAVHARAILDRASQITGDMRDAVGDPANRLAIAFNDDFMFGFLPDLLIEFARARPGLRLKSTLSITSEILEELRQGRLDAGFIALPLPISASSFNVIRFPPVPIMAILGSNHPLAKHKIVDLNDLRHEKIIYAPVSPESGFYLQITSMFQRAGFAPDVHMELWPAEHIAQFIESGEGVTLTTADSIRKDHFGVTIKRIADPEAIINPAVVWRGHGLTRTLSAFLDACRGYQMNS